MFAARQVGGTIIIQSGSHGSFLGRLDLEDRHVIGFKHELLVVEESIQPDKTAQALVEEAIMPYREELNQVVGHTSTALHRNLLLESSMDNLLLQSLLEHTFLQDAYCQMGGYVKRILGMDLYFKVENAAGQCIQELFVQGQPLKADQLYTAAFVTAQGVPDKYGVNRENLELHAVEGLRKYVAAKSPVDASQRGTVIAI